jgi:dynein light chain roadblock-type
MLMTRFQASEVEETLKRIQSHKGVVGTIVVNAEGRPTNHSDILTLWRHNSIAKMFQKARL